MRMKIAVGVFLFALVIAISASSCAKKERITMRGAFDAQAPLKEAAPPPMPGAFQPQGMMESAAAPTGGEGTLAQPAVYSPPDQKTLQVAVSQRKLISKAWRTVKVKDVEESYEKAVKVATQAGGFVESSSMEKGTEEKERRAELTLRVPANSLEKVMEEVKKLGEVLSTRMQGEDVTEQWADLQARIKNLRWEEEQLLKIMKEKAKTLDELLRMEGEVARLRGQIEQNEGRMTLLRDQVSLATLYLTLVEKGVAVEPIPSGSWALGGTLTHALRAALTGARAVVDFFIWFVMLGILWVPAAAVLFLVTRYAVGRVQTALAKNAASTDDSNRPSSAGH